VKRSGGTVIDLTSKAAEGYSCYVKSNPRFVACGVAIAFSLFFSVVHSFAFQLAEQSGAVSFTRTESDDRQNCETSTDARVQLDMVGGTVIRLGSNSALRSDGRDARVELLKGTALFDFAGQSQPLMLEHAGKQVTVCGGTGFARFAEAELGQEAVLLVGALAGKVKVTMNGQSRKVRPGELLAFDAHGKPLAIQFNLLKLAGSASLLNDFQSPLPNHEAIQRELKHFAALQKRGFIRSSDDASARQMLAHKTTLPTGPRLLTLEPSTSVSSFNNASVAGVSSSGAIMITAVGGIESSSGAVRITAMPPLPPLPHP